MNLFDIILVPFAWLLLTFYRVFHSYGLAIILFCLVTKIILFPLSLKGKKSMIKMSALSAQQQRIQKQYGNNREKMNQEIQKLYEKEKVNPMGGCLWSLLPLPILIGLYGVIRQPLKYLMNLTSDEINALSDFFFQEVITNTGNGEIRIAEALFNRFDEVAAQFPELTDRIFSLDFSFLGINLAQTPQLKFWENGVDWNSIGLFLIPVVSALLSYVSMKISMKTNVMNTGTENPMANNKMYSIMMPLISLWIGFTLPGGLGVYWIANSVFMIVQELLAGKMLKKEYAAMAAKRAEMEAREKEEEKERRRLAAEAKARAIAEGKKKKEERKKAAAAVSPAASRVGIRAHARGRAYDPYRFSPDGPTPYRDPGAPVDEEAVSRALEEKEERREQQEMARRTEELVEEGLAAARVASASDGAAGADSSQEPEAAAEDTEKVDAVPEEGPAEEPGDYEAEAAPESEEASESGGDEKRD